MQARPSTPEPIHPPNPWAGIVLLAGFGGLFSAFVAMGALALLAAPGPADPVLPWFLGVMGLAPLVLVGKAAHHAWRTLRHGRSTLLLDAPVRVGGWISGQVRARTRLQEAEIRLHVRCIKTSRGIGRGSVQQLVQWSATVVIDGAGLDRSNGQVLVPFAVRIPDTPPPTAPGDESRVDWEVGVEASLAGVDYTEEFAVVVLPADPTVPVASTPPRAMPVLPPEQITDRLGAVVEAEGDAMVIRLPFPVASATLLSVFSLATIAIVALGIPGTNALDDRDARLTAAAVSGGLAAVTLLVLMLSTRRIEVRRKGVRLVRGLFGFGFHTAIPAGDVVAVEETSTPDPQATTYYRVGLRTRQGTLHATAMRLRDPVAAKALARTLEGLLLKHP
jgi:hypothetical protein